MSALRAFVLIPVSVVQQDCPSAGDELSVLTGDVMQVFLNDLILSWRGLEIFPAGRNAGTADENITSIKERLLGGEINENLGLTFGGWIILPAFEDWMSGRAPAPGVGHAMRVNPNVARQFGAPAHQGTGGENHGKISA